MPTVTLPLAKFYVPVKKPIANTQNTSLAKAEDLDCLVLAEVEASEGGALANHNVTGRQPAEQAVK